jgi:hypothetical protein
MLSDLFLEIFINITPEISSFGNSPFLVQKNLRLVGSPLVEDVTMGSPAGRLEALRRRREEGRRNEKEEEGKKEGRRRGEGA